MPQALEEFEKVGKFKGVGKFTKEFTKGSGVFD
jgi:hypothetical protein